MPTRSAFLTSSGAALLAAPALLGTTPRLSATSGVFPSTSSKLLTGAAAFRLYEQRRFHTTTQTADASLTALMNQVGCTSIVEHQTLILPSSAPTKNNQVLQNCNPAQQNCSGGGGGPVFIEIFWDFPSINTNIGFGLYPGASDSGDSFSGGGGNFMGPWYGTYPMPKPYPYNCVGQYAGAIAIAAAGIVQQIKANPGMFTSQVLAELNTIIEENFQGEITAMGLIVGVGALVSSSAFLFLLGAVGVALITYFGWKACFSP